MKWDWLSAISGGVVVKLLDLINDWRKESRKRDDEEANRKRAEAEKEAERRRVEFETLRQDRARLEELKIRLKGCDNWWNVSPCPNYPDISAARLAPLGEIHNFFAERPQYVEISSNKDFLIRWPRNSPVDGYPDDLKEGLDELKRDVDTLRVQ